MWFFIFLSTLFSQVSIDSVEPSDQLELAAQESLQGNHQRVIDILSPLMYPNSQFATEEEEIKALRMLGLSYWFVEDYTEATKAFTMLLNRRPDFKLDPVVVPAGAILFFNQVKSRLREKLQEIVRLQKEEAERKKREKEEAERKRQEALRRNAPILQETTVIHRNYMLFNFFPLGVGQFQNGHDAKGWLLVGLQTLAATVSVSSYAYLNYKYPRGLVPKSEVVSARQIQYLQVGTGAAFFGLWMVGVVDALVFHKPTRTTVERRFVPRRQGLEIYGAPLESGGFFIGLQGEY